MYRMCSERIGVQKWLKSTSHKKFCDFFRLIHSAEARKCEVFLLDTFQITDTAMYLENFDKAIETITSGVNSYLRSGSPIKPVPFAFKTESEYLKQDITNELDDWELSFLRRRRLQRKPSSSMLLTLEMAARTRSYRLWKVKSTSVSSRPETASSFDVAQAPRTNSISLYVICQSFTPRSQQFILQLHRRPPRPQCHSFTTSTSRCTVHTNHGLDPSPPSPHRCLNTSSIVTSSTPTAQHSLTVLHLFGSPVTGDVGKEHAAEVDRRSPMYRLMTSARCIQIVNKYPASTSLPADGQHQKSVIPRDTP